MHGGNPVITLKIPNIQRQEMPYSMHAHGGGKTRIMHLNAEDCILHNDSSPRRIDGFALLQQRHAALDDSNFIIRLRWRQPEAVARYRPRHLVPKFREVLVRVVISSAIRGAF